MKRSSLGNLFSIPAGYLRRPFVPAGVAFIFFAGALLNSGCRVGSEKSVFADKSAAAEVAGHKALPTPPPRSVKIPNGTVLTVRLLQSISSRTAHEGEDFDAELAAPVTVQGNLIFPKSARVRGRVVSARESGRLHEPGYLLLSLNAVQTADGKWVEIRTTYVSAQGKSQKDRNWTLIGGGTGLGAAIEALAGGGKGAAVGTASGAGAGTAGAYATGKEDAVFAAERKLNFATVGEMVMNR